MPARPSPLNTKGHGITVLSKNSFSPLPSELPRTPVYGHFDAFKSYEEAMKTPITPPSAYMEFLKNTANSPAIASPNLLHHFPYSPAPSSGGSATSSSSAPLPGCRSLSHHGFYTPATPYPPHPLPSSHPHSSSAPVLIPHSHSHSLSLPSSAKTRKPRMPHSPASGNPSPTTSNSGSQEQSSFRSAVSVDSLGRDSERAHSAVDSEIDKDETMSRGRSRSRSRSSCSGSSSSSSRSSSSSGSSSSDSGRVTVKQVVTTTVTYTPRTMSLMPAPKGKRRRIA
jgi:hypothetical protein